MPLIHVVDRKGVSHDVEAAVGQPLMFVLRDDAGLPVEGLCGGCAACGTCHVFIAEAWIAKLPRRGGEEEAMLDSLAHTDQRRSRLACQIDMKPELAGLELTLAQEE